MGRGYPPPQPTRGLGERRKLPQLGPRAEPKRILVNFELKNESGDYKFDIFLSFYSAYLESNLQG